LAREAGSVQTGALDHPERAAVAGEVRLAVDTPVLIGGANFVGREYVPLPSAVASTIACLPSGRRRR